MFLLSVLFMTAWLFSVVTGFAGGFAHLMGLGSVAMIIMKGERRRPQLHSKDSSRPATIRRQPGVSSGIGTGSFRGEGHAPQVA